MPLEVIDKILDAAHGPLWLDNLKFRELADVLQISASFIVYYEISVDIFSEFLIL